MGYTHIFFMSGNVLPANEVEFGIPACIISEITRDRNLPVLRRTWHLERQAEFPKKGSVAYSHIFVRKFATSHLNRSQKSLNATVCLSPVLHIQTMTSTNQLSVVPEEMAASSVDLVLLLAGDTARLAEESGEGVANTAASAMIQIVGQVR